MFLYIIRHGQPVYSPEEKLTDIGWQQARALAPRMVQSGITKIYSSPLRRARETAQPTADALGLEIGIEQWTSENIAGGRFGCRENGQWKWIWSISDPASLVREEGKPWYETEKIKELLPNAAESYAELERDSDEFLARHGYERIGNEYKITSPNDERIAVFCHQGFGLSWLSQLLRIPPTFFFLGFDITHTGVTVLEFKNDPSGFTFPKCLCLSDMSHLFACGDTDYLYHTSFKI